MFPTQASGVRNIPVSSLHVAVFDDDPEIPLLLVNYLSAQGWHVFRCKRSFIPVLSDGGMMCALLDGSGGQFAVGPRFQGSRAS